MARDATGNEQRAGGQLDAASGYNREGMKPPESSSYLPSETKETTVGKGDEAQRDPEGWRGGDLKERFGLKGGFMC